VLLVYAPALPRTGLGKVMRVRMAERMGLPTIDESTPEHASSRMDVPSTLAEDRAPAASVDHRKAPAAPTHPGAPPEQLESVPWLQQPASGRRPKVGALPRSTRRHARHFEVAEKPPAKATEPIPCTQAAPPKPEALPRTSSASALLGRMTRSVSRIFEWEVPSKDVASDHSETEKNVQRIWLTIRAAVDERGCPVDEDLMLLGGSSIKMGALASQLSSQ
jgi:hypothetical protein